MKYHFFKIHNFMDGMGPYQYISTSWMGSDGELYSGPKARFDFRNKQELADALRLIAEDIEMGFIEQEKG